jgi:hypothetical protein
VDAAANISPSDQLAVEIRNRIVPATVVPLPFYHRKS